MTLIAFAQFGGFDPDRRVNSSLDNRTRFEPLKLELGSQKQGTSTLILSAPGDLQRTLLETIATLNERVEGKILLLNGTMSSRSISENLEEKGVSTKNLHFLDLVPGLDGAKPAQTDSSRTVLTDRSILTEVLISIRQRLGSTNTQVLVLDSLGTLPIYHEMGSVIKFVHVLVSRLTAKGVTSVILSPKEEGDNMTEKIAPFFNTIVELAGPSLSERVNESYGRWKNG